MTKMHVELRIPKLVMMKSYSGESAWGDVRIEGHSLRVELELIRGRWKWWGKVRPDARREQLGEQHRYPSYAAARCAWPRIWAEWVEGGILGAMR